MEQLKAMDNHDFELLYTCIMSEMKVQEREAKKVQSSSSSGGGIQMEEVRYYQQDV